MSKVKIALYYYLPFVVWLGMIHFSSSQSYEDQNVQPILKGVNLDWMYNWFSWVSFRYGESVVSLETRTPEAFVEFFLRKGAHLFVFAVLGIFALRLLHLYIRNNIYCAALLALGFVVVYAAVDEYRQLLHPNRSGMVEDVVLDSIGGALGIAAFLLIRNRLGRKTKEKNALNSGSN